MQISDQNFGTFVRTMATVLEEIEERQANARREREALAAQQATPAAPHRAPAHRATRGYVEDRRTAA